MCQGSVHPEVSGGPEEKKSGGELLARSAVCDIESHYKERFSLKEIAGRLYVNGSYLLRVFRKHTGYTPLAYHNHIRCERAKELLAGTGRPVSDIGEAVGFVSSAHFSHVFRKTVGCTPSEYRAACRAERAAAGAGDPDAQR